MTTRTLTIRIGWAALALFVLVAAGTVWISADWCRCGHTRAAHEHYRPGTDCGTCGPAVCPRFRRPRISTGD